MNLTRKFAALVASLLLVLAIPASALAASDPHTVTESFSATQAVGVTVSTSVVYTYAGNSKVTGTIPVTAFTSTFAPGASSLQLARTNSAGGNAFDLNKTDAATSATTGFVAPTTTDIVSGCTGPTAGCGTGANHLTATGSLKTLISQASGDVTNGATTITMGVWGITTTGAWTGALNVQATN